MMNEQQRALLDIAKHHDERFHRVAMDMAERCLEIGLNPNQAARVLTFVVLNNMAKLISDSKILSPEQAGDVMRLLVADAIAKKNAYAGD